MYFIPSNYPNLLLQKANAERSEVLRQGFYLSEEVLVLDL